MIEQPIYEFCKLDPIDFKVALWLFDNCPHALFSYLDFVAKNVYRRKGVSLDAIRVLDGLIELRKTHVDNSMLELPEHNQYHRPRLKPAFIL